MSVPRCVPPVEVGDAELRVGDTIEVWWSPGRDTITDLCPYRGALECLKGGQFASFALFKVGMTIEPGSRYLVLNRVPHTRIEEISDPGCSPTP